MIDLISRAELIADRYFQRGLEPERRQHLVDDIVIALKDERERSALAAESRGKELREWAIGSDIANTIRDPSP